MARGEWGIQGRGKWVCSYKKTTLIVCFINIAVALYFLRSLYSSLYIYSGNVSRNIVIYTPDQIRTMEESIRIREAYKPVELVEMAKKLEEEFSREKLAVQLPRHLKQKLTDDILKRLRNLNINSTSKFRIAKEREAVESWCREKGKEAKLVLEKGQSNSTIAHKEAGMLLGILKFGCALLSEEIGLWIPPEVSNVEHDDKPQGEEGFDEEVLPGRPLPRECNAELHTDYDGAAVRWGLTHHKDSAADCCQACLDQARNAKRGEMRCNIWVYCPSEFGCHSPDIYEHKYMECWLKYAEKPRLFSKNRYPESYRNSHPSAPVIVPWASGVISA